MGDGEGVDVCFCGGRHRLHYQGRACSAGRPVHPLATLRAPAHIGKVHTDAYTGPRYTLRLLKQVPRVPFPSPHSRDGGRSPAQFDLKSASAAGGGGAAQDRD